MGQRLVINFENDKLTKFILYIYIGQIRKYNFLLLLLLLLGGVVKEGKKFKRKKRDILKILLLSANLKISRVICANLRDFFFLLSSTTSTEPLPHKVILNETTRNN